MTPDDVQKLIDESIAEAMKLATDKRGDTPTDDLQLVNKKYVDSNRAVFFSQVGNIANGVSQAVIPHGLGGTPSVYGVSPTSNWYYGPTTTTYTLTITVDSTNITLDKSPNSTISTGYIVFAKL